MAVKLGLDVLRDSGFAPLRGRRVGLLTNPSAVDRELSSTYRILTRAPEISVTALFAPEHGFAGVMPDGELITATVDARTGLPVHSLYGESLLPTGDMLMDVDVLVCDIQDIGVRYYTYPWTISYVLEAAGEHSVPVLILDRPNPLGGVRIAGPTLDMSLSSLVGRYPMPVQHGLTLGEMARWMNGTWNSSPADLTVTPCEGWRRDQQWEQAHLCWVPPSPNMPHLSTLHHYPGACLVEGTNLSEGRGTALPFEIVGAPGLDALTLADRLNREPWAAAMGARFRPHCFRPTASKWAGEDCQGVQVHIADLDRWRPIEVWLGVIATIRAVAGQFFAWNQSHFDRLTGSPWIRKALETGGEKPPGTLLAQLAAEWIEDCNAFSIERRPFLLYE